MSPPATDRTREILAEIRARRERGQALPRAVGRTAEETFKAGLARPDPAAVLDAVAMAPDRIRRARRRRGFARVWLGLRNAVLRPALGVATRGLIR